MFRDLPRPAQVFTAATIAAGAGLFVWLLPRVQLAPYPPLLFLALLSWLTSAFQVRLPIAGSSNMSMSYIVDIAALILRGPHTTMLIAAFGGWAQSTFDAAEDHPPHRTLFTMATLVLTIEASGCVYGLLTRSPGPFQSTLVPLVGAALAYFVCSTAPVAVALALSGRQSAWPIWRTGFASSAPMYIVGAATAAIIITVTETTSWPLAALLTLGPLYLSYRIHRAGIEAEARQGAILEAAHDAIITLDQQLNIREFNPAAEEMFGHARTTIIGRSVELLLPRIERAAAAAAFARYLDDGSGPLAHRRLELTCVRADGTEFPVELTVAGPGRHGRTLTGFVRDLTERRRLEAQLRESQKLEAIGRLAGGVAHDFNNILMSIMGATELLMLQLPPGAPAHIEAGEIKRSVQRGAGLTRQLLAFGRRQAAHPELLRLSDVVAGMETMLRCLIGPEIDLAVSCDPSAPAVRADPSQIEQIVLNLVVNARDAMPQGGRVSLAVDAVRLDGADALALAEGRAGEYARLAVTDSGAGMDDSTKARLFEPFFTTKPGRGGGLGLSIVYGIVKQNDGHITVASERGRGTRVVVHLPAAAQRVPARV